MSALSPEPAALTFLTRVATVPCWASISQTADLPQWTVRPVDPSQPAPVLSASLVQQLTEEAPYAWLAQHRGLDY